MYVHFVTNPAVAAKSNKPLLLTLDRALLQCSARSTEHSTLRGTVKCVSAFGPNNNQWRRWMRMVAAFSGGLAVQVGWLGLHGVGSHPALSLHSSNEPGELSQ